MGRRMAWLGLLAAAALASPASAQDTAPPSSPPVSPAPAAPPPETLTGLAAWDRLKGNTIEGKVAGESFAEFFDAAGTVKYVDKDGLSTGTWAVQKAKVCFDFPEDDDRSCSTFEVTGEGGTSRDDDGSVVRFQITPGNGKGL